MDELVDEVVGVVMERTRARRNRLTAAVIASGLFVGPQALGVAGATPDDTDGTATASSSPASEEQGSHEIWGGTDIWVKRARDGWNPSPSDAWKASEYWDPKAISDWAVFTIDIKSL